MKRCSFFILRYGQHHPNAIKIIDNLAWLFVDKVLRMGVGLLVGVWLARYLGPEQFGLLNYALALLALFSTVAAVGLNPIVVRESVHQPDAAPVILGSALLLRLIAGSIAIMAMNLTLYALRPDDPLAQISVLILSMTLLFRASEVVRYWFESQVQLRYWVWVENSLFLLMSGVKVVLILHAAPFIAFIWVILIEAGLLAIGVGWIYWCRTQTIAWRVRYARLKQLLHDSWLFMFSAMAMVLYTRIDQIMLGEMVGNDAVGLYSAATRISEAWYFIPVIIVTSLFPAILKAKQRSESAYYQRLQQLMDLVIWLSVAVAIAVTLLSDRLITGLFGEAYQAAAGVLVIHIWASLLMSLGLVGAKWFVAENHALFNFQRTAVGVALNVLLNWLLIPKYGIDGAAIATLITHLWVNLLYDGLQKMTRPLFWLKLGGLNPLAVIRRLVTLALWLR
ncbi:flippase [Ectothiorhodospiraceae bacterium BW-2]|nr:flippase [Ectothiorhodospiraceae bacterium BW-2]